MTSRYAIVGRWYADPHHSAGQDRELHDIIVPMVQQRPGFLAGYWTRDPESGRTHATILFDNQATAQEFKTALEAGRQHAATLGITNDYLIVADVLAEAHPLISPE